VLLLAVFSVPSDITCHARLQKHFAYWLPSCSQVEVVNMDNQTLNAWLVAGQFANDSMEVPRLDNSTKFNVTSFMVSEHTDSLPVRYARACPKTHTAAPDVASFPIPFCDMMVVVVVMVMMMMMVVMVMMSFHLCCISLFGGLL
jgi:hypothetical protein